jgi:hypothetical protein
LNNPAAPLVATNKTFLQRFGEAHIDKSQLSSTQLDWIIDKLKALDNKRGWDTSFYTRDNFMEAFHNSGGNGDLIYVKFKHAGSGGGYAGTSFNANDKNNNVFATGGAFTNGVVERPTQFDMGLMGEAGAEAIMPLANVGGKLGVYAIAANDGSDNNAELIAQLRQQNQQLRQQNLHLTDIITLLQAGFGQVIVENKKQSESLDYIERKTRLNATRQNSVAQVAT